VSVELRSDHITTPVLLTPVQVCSAVPTLVSTGDLDFLTVPGSWLLAGRWIAAELLCDTGL
jgi:hypothetical protein